MLGHVGSSRPPWGDLKGAVSPHARPLPRSWVSREPRCRPPLKDLLLCSHHRLQPPLVSQPVMHFLHPYKVCSGRGGLFSTLRLNKASSSSECVCRQKPGWGGSGAGRRLRVR